MAAETAATAHSGVDGSADPVIAIENLSLTFETDDGPVHALSGIDLSVERGEFVSLIGPSGCGKTTQEPQGAWTHDVTDKAMAN